MFILSGLIVAFELVALSESTCSDEKITCRCGVTDSTVSLSCINYHGDENPCEVYERCETCQDDVTHCITCPAGHSGPFCDQVRNPNATDGISRNSSESRLASRSLSCPDLKSPKPGTFDCWYQGYNKECTGRCSPGHSFANKVKEVTLVCQYGIWTPYTSFPPCISEGYCQLDISGGYYNCTTEHQGTTYCDITCSGRRFRPSNGRYVCYPGDSWDPPLPHCAKPRESGEVIEKPVCDCQNGGSCNPRNQRCICLSGFSGRTCEIKSGEAIEKPICDCQNGGSCNPRNQRCICLSGFSGRICEIKENTVQISCPLPEQLQNGKMRNSDGRLVTRNQKFQEGSSIVFSCDPEFALVGESLLTCSAFGTWSNSVPECSPAGKSKTETTEESSIYCKDPGVDSNGIKTLYPDINRRTGSDSGEDQYPQGMLITYSCKDGYNIRGEESLRCLHTGKWSAPTPTCHPIPASITREPVYCDNPGEIRNGRKSILPFPDPRTRKNVEKDSADLPEGVQLIYSCNPGFSVLGNAVIECLSTGTWSSGVPICAKGTQECGHSFFGMTRKIINGQKTVEGEWPWQVAYAETRRAGMTIICGAALLNHRTVITAAHCINPRRLDKTYMYFGKFHADFNEDDDQVVSRKVTEFIVHPSYNRRNMDNDIALVRFAPDVTYNTRIQPICLPTPDTTAHNMASGKGWVTGWGTTENGSDSDILLMAQLPVVSTTQCRQTYKSLNIAVLITENMFCAGYESGEVDSCSGDSGGPMVFYNNRTETYVQEGIVSFGVKGPTGACGQQNRYGVYVKVANYVPWIRQNA